jgi:hypothetical protein
LVPKKYCFTIAGSVNAFQTSVAGALMVILVFKVMFVMIVVLKE